MIFEDETYRNDMIELQMYLAIEHSFGIELKDTEVLKLDTKEDLVKLIKKKYLRRLRNSKTIK